MENESIRCMKSFGNITGAFADGAVLFPILAALSVQAGMDGNILLATAGIAYLVAGFVFRVPMSVQPLKSVAVTALALGASAAEIGMSGFLVGAVCLGLSFCYADKLADLVPRHIVQGLQLALGIMLMTKGGQWGFLVEAPAESAIFVLLTGGILAWSMFRKQPILGWVAAAGLAVSLALVAFGDAPASQEPSDILRPEMILALVLPQIALTLTNSVVGTQDVARRYFPQESQKVTPTRLLRLIGIGNILFAPIGGLPFCHGSGGVTAHVKGGARTWHMNLIIGGTLVMLAAGSWIFALPLIPAYPQILMAILLFVTGVFHVTLAAPSWGTPHLRWILVVIGLVAFGTQNMLWALAAGVVCEGVRTAYMRRFSKG